MDDLNLSTISVFYLLGLCAEFRNLSAQEPKCSNIWLPILAIILWPLYEFAELIYVAAIATKRRLTK